MDERAFLASKQARRNCERDPNRFGQECSYRQQPRYVNPVQVSLELWDTAASRPVGCRDQMLELCPIDNSIQLFNKH